MGLIQQLTEQYGDTISNQLSSHLGLSEEQAASIVPKLAPIMLGGLAKQAQDRGAESVEETVKSHGDPSILDDLPNFMSKQAESQDPLADLGAMLGGAAPQVQDLISGKSPLGSILGGGIKEMAGKALAKKLEVDKDQALKILPMVVPVVMAFVAKSYQASGREDFIAQVEQDGNTAVIDKILAKFSGGGLPGGLGNLFSGKS